MSFRQFGGLNYAARHNIVSSNYNTSNNLLVTQNVGQPNSYINFLSDISGNISIFGNFDISGNITANQFFIKGPVIDVPNSVVPKSYVDALANGLEPKTGCQCATTTVISGTYNTSNNNEFTLVGSPLTIDGYTVQDNDRVLVKNQGSLDPTLGGFPSVQNGIYYYSSGSGGTLTRTTDMPVDSNVGQAVVPVQFGTLNSSSVWFQALGSSQSPQLVGTDELEFVIYVDLNIALGQGLNNTSSNGITYLNVDSSLNFINFLDSNTSVSGANGTLALGTNTTNKIVIGPTGTNVPIQAQNIIECQKGITGPTGSFEFLKVGTGGKIGEIGNSLDVSGNMLLVNSIYNVSTTQLGYSLGLLSTSAPNVSGVLNSNIAVLSQGYETAFVATRGNTFNAGANPKNFFAIYQDAISNTNYNPITKQNDHVLVTGRYGGNPGASDVSGGIVICPWSSKSSGARMDTSGNFTFYNPISAPIGITGATGSFSYLNSSNNTYLATTTGSKVGIGKTNPAYTLDVNGNSIINGNLTITTELDIYNNNNTLIRIVGDETNNYIESATSTSSVTKPLLFSPYGSAISRLYIDMENNRVGIAKGTTPPSYTLDVNGTGNFSGIITALQPSLDDNSSKVPTTSWVKSLIPTTVTLTAFSQGYNSGGNYTFWYFSGFPTWAAYSWVFNTPTSSRTNVNKNVGSTPPFNVGEITANGSFILMTGTGISQVYTATSSTMITYCAGFSQAYTISASATASILTLISSTGATAAAPFFISQQLSENTSNCPPTANGLSGYVVIQALNGNFTGLGVPTMTLTQLIA